MVLVVADLPARGRELKLDGVEWASNAVASGLGGTVKAFAGGLTIARHGVHVSMVGELHAVGEVACSRCGIPLVVSIGGDVSCAYSPLETLPERTADEEGLPEPPVDLGFEVSDVGEYDGTSFDVALALTEWAAIEAPVRLRCGDIDESDDEACTARFRALAQTPAQPAVDPRFAILQSLKPSSEM